MSKAQVAITRAEAYDYDEIRAAARDALALIGGLDGIIGPGTRVFLKINQLPPPSAAERCVVTHPVFVKAVASLLKEAGAVVTAGDDIGSEKPDGFDVSGMRRACAEANIRLVNLKEGSFVRTELSGRKLAHTYLAKEAMEADVIVNLPKLKTHALTAFTGAVKNIYGLQPQGTRVKLHGEFINTRDFALMVTDIYAVARPELNIMDAVMAMQGEGPAGGTPRHLGLVLASRDGVALDAVGCHIIGLGRQAVHTTRHAAARGLGTADLGQIEVLGEDLESVVCRDFKLPANATSTFLNAISYLLPRRQSEALILRLLSRPVVNFNNCTGCGECVQVCPTTAVLLHHGKAEIEYDRCIRCLCCSEACRDDAMEPERPLLARIALGGMRRGK